MSMTICDDRHEPVVYTDYDHRNKFHECPVCEAMDRIAELEEYNTELENRVHNLEKENDSFEDRFSELEDINKELHDEIKGLKGE